MEMDEAAGAVMDDDEAAMGALTAAKRTTLPFPSMLYPHASNAPLLSVVRPVGWLAESASGRVRFCTNAPAVVSCTMRLFNDANKLPKPSSAML